MIELEVLRFLCFVLLFEILGREGGKFSNS